METASKKQSRLPSKIAFGNQVIASSLAFLSAKNAIGIVDNQAPITYNTIILPKRGVTKFGDLNENEAIDLFMFAHKTAKLMELHVEYIRDEDRSVEVILRDGIGAGDEQDQTCIWLVPRHKGERVIFEEGCAKLKQLGNHSRIQRTDTLATVVSDGEEDLDNQGTRDEAVVKPVGDYLENLQEQQQKIRDYAALLKGLIREDRVVIDNNVKTIE